MANHEKVSAGPKNKACAFGKMCSVMLMAELNLTMAVIVDCEKRSALVVHIKLLYAYCIWNHCTTQFRDVVHRKTIMLLDSLLCHSW